MKTILTILLIAFSVLVRGQVKEPFLHYSFDNTLIDSMLTGNDLTAYGNASFANFGVPIGSHNLMLDGDNDYAKIPTIDLGDTTLYSFWFKSMNTISSLKYIISGSDSSYSDNFSIRVLSDGLFDVYCGSNSTNNANTFTHTSWNHFAVLVCDTGSNIYCRIWNNGSEWSFTDRSLGTSYDNTTRLNIGVDHYINRDLYGDIDELRIYKGIIPSQAQIDSLHNLSYIGSGGGSTPYLPVAGRDVWPTFRGVRLKPKYNGYLYWNAKSQLETILDSIGITADIRVGDYDGVCPSGATRWTDTDCAVNNFQYAPLRKIKDTTDYATKVYIDPTYGSGGDGSLATPFDSWGDITQAPHTAYLFKKGTTWSGNIDISEDDVLLGSYGVSGDKPKIVNTNVSHCIDVLTDSCTVRDLYIDNNTVLQYSITNEARTSYSNINMQGASNNTDIFNCDLMRGGFAVGQQNGVHLVDRIVKCTIDSMFTEGIYMTNANYLEISWVTITNINIAYAINPDYNYGGTNKWCTGDGIQHQHPSVGWKEQWIHHCYIDRRPYGAKACIMMHNNTANHLRDITEFCTFYAPENSGISGQSTQCINSGSVTGESVFNNNIFHAVECDYNLVGLYCSGADSVIGNVFEGFDDALQRATNAVVENNTFYNNVNAIRYASGSVARLFNNIFWLNTTNLNTITAAASGNNLYTDPLFVDAANNDFRLNEGSNAIDVGAIVPYRVYDIDGNSVPENTIPDIGAYEYIP